MHASYYLTYLPIPLIRLLPLCLVSSIQHVHAISAHTLLDNPIEDTGQFGLYQAGVFATLAIQRVARRFAWTL